MLSVASRCLPLLALYITIVWLYAVPEFHADEARYVKYAVNLAQGYFSPPNRPALGNGPGYSLFLVPFVVFDIPWIVAKLCNAVFLYIAVLYFYATLCFYTNQRTAFWCAYVFGLYSLFMKYIDLMHTEVLGVFLISGLIYHFCAVAHSKQKTLHTIAAASYFAYLALSKIFFGYPLLLSLLVATLGYVLLRERVLARAAVVCGLAMLLCLPYLVYTYSVTGKVFYWGTKGGASLYWMTSPHPYELGDWKANTLEQLYAHNEPDLIANHRELFVQQPDLSSTEWDDLTKRRAFENIQQYPLKFLYNWVANVGRLAFNYPYSYVPQRVTTYYYLIPNFLLFALCLLALIPTVLGWRRIPGEIYALLFLALASFAGSTLLSATVRYLIPIVPIAALWLAVVFARNVRVKFLSTPSES